MLFWMMGDASTAARPWPALVVLALALVAVMPFARDLNVLARGELSARALGVRVGHLRVALYVLASLLTATSVTLVGSVGFVGLVVPHLVRLVLGSDQRVLIPPPRSPAVRCATLDTEARTVRSRRSSCRWACSPR